MTKEVLIEYANAYGKRIDKFVFGSGIPGSKQSRWPNVNSFTLEVVGKIIDETKHVGEDDWMSLAYPMATIQTLSGFLKVLNPKFSDDVKMIKGVQAILWEWDEKLNESIPKCPL